MSTSKSVQLSFLDTNNIMNKSQYDTNNDGIVDTAHALSGAASTANNTFYGKVGGAVGFYEIEAGAGALSALTDVTLTGLSANQVLVYDGSKFVNAAVSYANITGKPTLSTVATSGSYNDLTNKPSIPTLPTLSTVATSGSYNDLSDKPSIPTLPTLSTVATTGSYSDLSNKPSIPTTLNTLTDVNTTGATAGQVLTFQGGSWVPTTVTSGGGGANSLNELSDVTLTSLSANQVLVYDGSKFVNAAVSYANITGKPTLSTVATSGSYNDLTNKPTIPTLPALSTVATTGSYNDLTNKPTIPTSLGHLSDANVAIPTDGQVLMYDSSVNKFRNKNPIKNLGDLENVNTSGASNGQVLTYQGGSWVPATSSGGGGGGSNVIGAPASVCRFKVLYNGSNMAIGEPGTSDTYSDYASYCVPTLIENTNVNQYITQITFTGFNYPPASIMLYGFDAATNRYEIRPMLLSHGTNIAINLGTIQAPSTFGSFSKMNLATAVAQSGAAPKIGLPAVPGHTWVVMVMQG